MASQEGRPFNIGDTVFLKAITTGTVPVLPTLAAWPTGPDLARLSDAREALHVGQSKVANVLGCPRVADWEAGTSTPHPAATLGDVGVSGIFRLYAALLLESEEVN